MSRRQRQQRSRLGTMIFLASSKDIGRCKPAQLYANRARRTSRRRLQEIEAFAAPRLAAAAFLAARVAGMARGERNGVISLRSRRRRSRRATAAAGAQGGAYFCDGFAPRAAASFAPRSVSVLIR